MCFLALLKSVYNSAGTELENCTMCPLKYVPNLQICNNAPFNSEWEFTIGGRSLNLNIVNYIMYDISVFMYISNRLTI